MQQMNVQQVWQLLRACIGKKLFLEVSALLQLPAATQLPAAAIQELSQQLLQAIPPDVPADKATTASWVTLLTMPHAAELLVSAVQQLYNTALGLELIGMANTLLSALPQQAQGVYAAAGEQATHALLAAIKRVVKGGDLMHSPYESVIQGLDTGSCVQLVVALLQLSNQLDVSVPWQLGFVPLGIGVVPQTGGIALQVLQLLCTVLQARACQHMQAGDVVRIMKACLGPAWRLCGADSIPLIPIEPHEQCLGTCLCHPHCALLALQAVSAFPTAAQFEPGQLLEVLTEACQTPPSALVWQALLQLPAAQQMLPAQLADVLHKLLRSSCAESTPYLGHASYDVGVVVDVFLQHPVGQQLGSEDVAALLTYLVQQTLRAGLLAVAGRLLQHPAGQQLSGDALAQLMQVTVWEQDFVALNVMCLQHPGAASMSANSVQKLLGLFAGHAWLPWSSGVVSQLLQLPAAQQLSLDDIKPVLWQACQVWDTTMCEGLCACQLLLQHGMILGCRLQWQMSCCLNPSASAGSTGTSVARSGALAPGVGGSPQNS
jgi:hypothetical protein